ncbi:MAG: hypothetical protein LBD24_08480 [Spirochaetaceae bacterium]|nr:hypothetical protein [Spirochaetaceae bacterium]
MRSAALSCLRPLCHAQREAYETAGGCGAALSCLRPLCRAQREAYGTAGGCGARQSGR